MPERIPVHDIATLRAAIANAKPDALVLLPASIIAKLLEAADAR